VRIVPPRPPRTRSLRLVSAALAALLTATACGSGTSSSASSGAGDAPAGGGAKVRVVATTTQVADFARAIGGDRITLTQILRPNIDPHDYEPSPADVQALAAADVVIKNGVGLEKWLDEAISSSGFHGTTVDTSRGVTIRQGDGSAEERAGDPHIWHNPENAQIMSADIAAALSAEDPADRTAFGANLAAYTAKLTELDGWITGQIATIPADRRKLVTNHDAFGYYVDRYRLTFVGSIIPGFDTSAELSARALGDLVTKIKATGVTAVFSESSLPPKTAEAIGREAGVRVEAGADSLYGDTLGPAGSAGATYLAMERHNTSTIVTALKG
jgi:ABC-type Zn uptake system ZnuABC Zn-binding protein ZnuA